MKLTKLFVLIMLLTALLAGCLQGDTTLPATQQTTLPVTSQTAVPETSQTVPQTTTPSVPITTIPEPVGQWIEEVGMPWDREGALLEIPLTIPDGLHYRSAINYDGDLLLWSIDAHLADQKTIEMCLVDLENGEILGQKDIAVTDYLVPQVFEGVLYICDSASGNIFGLDKSLEIVLHHQIDPVGGTWYMGANHKVYQHSETFELFVFDLETNTSQQLLFGAKDIWTYTSDGITVNVDYYSAETGGQTSAILDLTSGELCYDPFGKDFYSVSNYGEVWLCGKYTDHNIYYLANGNDRNRIVTWEDNLQLLPDGRILRLNYDCLELQLYNLQGKAIAQCYIQEEFGYYATPSCMIWSDAYQGYFLWITSEGDASRLLFWDISVPGEPDALELEKIPEPSEEEILLKNRAEELSLKYGVTVLVGDDCDTVFDEFTATLATDFDHVSTALNTLENALSAYPDGFLNQLRYGGIRGIQIQLISDLQATGGGREGGGYNAFTQNMWDHYLIVMDIDDSSVDTYYHEFSHIIDSFLAWDASFREDALFSEEGWNDLNPAWFEGYTFDYSWEQTVKDYSWFIDSYSTISPTEDRARVLEKAMSEFGYWYFVDSPGLQRKLSYYCQCIRDAFDTTGWPETTLWEQYA